MDHEDKRISQQEMICDGMLPAESGQSVNIDAKYSYATVVDDKADASMADEGAVRDDNDINLDECASTNGIGECKCASYLRK